MCTHTYTHFNMHCAHTHARTLCTRTRAHTHTHTHTHPHRYDRKEDVELYDLSKDIGEQSDVSHLNPSIVQQAVQYMDDAHVPGPKCHGERERPEEL